MDHKCCLLAVLFSLCVCSVRAYHRRKWARDWNPCALGPWRKHVDYRFWTLKCKTRRQVTSAEEKRLVEFASRERGPTRTDDYNPTYGYEPYWEFGDWVFEKIRVPDYEVKICGHRCSKMFIQYGPICAHNNREERKTFPTICHLRNSDCKKRYNWQISYRGVCLGDLPTMYTKNRMWSRADMYLKHIYPLTITTTTRPPFGPHIG